MEKDIDLEEVKAAVDTLKAGGIILYPTDTVWGIGCDATNEAAVAKVFELKKRSDSKSLITLVADADMLGKYVKVIPEVAINLLEVNDKPMTIKAGERFVQGIFLKYYLAEEEEVSTLRHGGFGSTDSCAHSSNG